MKKKICKSLVTVIACLLIAVPVSAAQQGSLLLTKVGQPVTLFSVADKQGIPAEAFAGTVEKLDQSDLTPKVADKFYKRIQERDLSGTTGTPNQNNEVTFTDLKEGWYLVCSTGEAAEFTPFLICIPMAVGGQTVYDVEAEPKVDSPTEPTKPSDPVPPQPNIPQTGAILWPKYLLLILGVIAIGAGLVEVIRGREKQYE